jgi:N-acetylglucosamine malate deacetylase 1
MKNILVITPHPDDLELGCSGTLMKFKDEGANIESIITIRPSVEVNINRNEEIVQRELERSMSLLGFDYKVFETPLSSTERPQLHCNNDTITSIEKMMDKNHYDLIITTDPGDYHQDHKNTFNIANSICRGVASELWTMQISPYSHRNTSFNPNVYVDISKYMGRKIEAIRCYESYMSDKLINVYNGLAVYNSNAIKESAYAEAFEQKFRNIT